MKQQEAHIVKLGTLRISRESCTIVAGDNETKVSPRSMDVLIYLIEHAERVVSTEELLDRFWSSLASDHAVHKAIAELRAAMGESVRHQRHIRTLPKRGYRLVALDGGSAGKSTAAPVAMQLRQWSERIGRHQVALCATLVLMLVGLGMFSETKRADASALMLDMAPLCFDGVDGDGKGYLLIVGLVQTEEGSTAYPEHLSFRHGDLLNAQDVMACDIRGVLAPRLDATGG